MSANSTENYMKNYMEIFDIFLIQIIEIKENRHSILRIFQIHVLDSNINTNACIPRLFVLFGAQLYLGYLRV